MTTAEDKTRITADRPVNIKALEAAIEFVMDSCEVGRGTASIVVGQVADILAADSTPTSEDTSESCAASN